METNGKSVWALHPTAVALLGRKVRIDLNDGSALEALLTEAATDRNYLIVEMAFAGYRHGIRYTEIASLREMA